MNAVEGFTRQELLELSWAKPMMGQLELTRDCNQWCIFCYKDCGPQKNYAVLSTDQWKIIILKLKKLGVRRLHFSGGENFLHEGFEELVAFGKEQGFEIWMTTNGTFSCREVAKHADNIIFSIHGLEPTHDSITKLRGSFRLACDHMVEAAASTNVSVNMVLVKRNYGEIYDVFTYVNGLCRLSLFHATIPIKASFGANYEQEALVITKEMLDDYRATMARIPADQLGLKHGIMNIYFNDPAMYSSQAIPLPNCAAGKYKIVIDYDGEVYPCNFFHYEGFRCGNILTGDALEIWRNGRGFNRFRELTLQEVMPEKCHTCVKKHKCMGGCMAWTEEYLKGGFGNDIDLRCEAGNAFVGG